ncbi:MAG: putative membrane bound lytic murein transglycosylase B [Parcubacteria bacterium C7867-003]|nr:MAG: putative membrane bound lytic murein transglycosylase B [Parcubacteria bacterium C7867-003]
MINKNKSFIFCATVLFLGGVFAYSKVEASSSPVGVIQGEAIMIHIETDFSAIKKITFGGVPVSIFKYRNWPTGIVGIDLNKAPGIYPVTAELADGRTVSTSVEVIKKKIKTAPYTIPEKLGGNTVEAQKNLVSSLAEENSNFKHLATANKILWTSGFIAPLQSVTVNDEFGYHRQLGNMIMAHKGVDYKASAGTKVGATNDGVVRVVGDYRNYGKTVVIDHGLGVLSFYLHLSEAKVSVGQTVSRGEIIGLSGESGYADSPHLHFSIRIYGVSVDPVKFLELFR